jgi:hypothetical protein
MTILKKVFSKNTKILELEKEINYLKEKVFDLEENQINHTDRTNNGNKLLFFDIFYMTIFQFVYEKAQITKTVNKDGKFEITIKTIFNKYKYLDKKQDPKLQNKSELYLNFFELDTDIKNKLETETRIDIANYLTKLIKDI